MSEAEDPLVALIYATALDPSLWPEATAGVADRVGGSRVLMTSFNAGTAAGEVFAVRADPAMTALYAEHYQPINVFARGAEASSFINGWRPNVGVESQVVDWEDFQRSEFCNDYLRPQGVNAQMFIRLRLDGEAATTMTIGRQASKGRFEADDLVAANTFLPHLVRAYGLGRRFSARLGVSRDLALTLQAAPDATILVDEAGRVRMLNPPAERLLVQRRGLGVLAGRLVAEQSEPARRLEQLIRLATRSDGARIGGAMSLPVAGRRLPLAVRVAPIGAPAHPVFGRQGVALICVADLESDIASPEDELADLFGLTPAEARLASGIFEGLSLPEAAERFGVSPNTVRFQLARIFDKTGVSRQAELVKLMMRLAS